MIRYVWLDINTGEFSNSWDQETHDKHFGVYDDIEDFKGHKLIKYECPNDENFEFCNLMKIVTNR